MFATGKRYHHRFVTAISIPSNEIYSKTAFVCGKKTGSAVIRNSIKRRLKAIFYDQDSPKNDGFDLVLIGKKACLDTNYNCVKKEVYDLLFKINKSYE